MKKQNSGESIFGDGLQDGKRSQSVDSTAPHSNPDMRTDHYHPPTGEDLEKLQSPNGTRTWRMRGKVSLLLLYKGALPTSSPPKTMDSNQSSAVLVVAMDPKEQSSAEEDPAIQVETPILQFLGHLIEKGVAKKFYLSLVLEDVLTQEALLITGADITIMPADQFESLCLAMNHANIELKFQSCSPEIKPYSEGESTLSLLALIQVTIGSMTLVHPVYISGIDSTPLLIEKDFLDRLLPLLCFQSLGHRYVNLCHSLYQEVLIHVATSWRLKRAWTVASFSQRTRWTSTL